MKHTSMKMDSSRRALISYFVGFFFSILLTLFAFWIAPQFGAAAAPAIVAAAVLQLFVQLFFFLHVGREQKPQWNAGLLALTLVILCILIIGTLWIMDNLQRLHTHTAAPGDLYVGGIVAPQNELR